MFHLVVFFPPALLSFVFQRRNIFAVVLVRASCTLLPRETAATADVDRAGANLAVAYREWELDLRRHSARHARVHSLQFEPVRRRSRRPLLGAHVTFELFLVASGKFCLGGGFATLPQFRKPVAFFPMNVHDDCRSQVL